MKELIKKEETKNWMSKQELMQICKCSKTTIEQILNDLSCQTDLATQNHMKNGAI